MRPFSFFLPLSLLTFPSNPPYLSPIPLLPPQLLRLRRHPHLNLPTTQRKQDTQTPHAKEDASETARRQAGVGV